VAFSPIYVTADSFGAGSQEDPAAVAAGGRGLGLGSLAGSSWTFARCLRLITSPIRPAITSNVPANHEPLAPIAPEADPGAAGEPRQTAEAITRNRSVG
jgi:hypothetical protein